MYFVPAVVSKPIVAASVHGFIDFKKPLIYLTPYSYCFINMDSSITQFIFIPFSIIHFSRDVGKSTSIFLHIFWICISEYDYNLAWIIFCLYYSFHSLLTLSKVDDEYLNFYYIIIFLLFPEMNINITDIMTKIIVSHIFSEELYNWNSERLE